MARAKILVVEDEGIVAIDIQNRLRRLGYDVPAIAAYGEEAVRKAAETGPDLVLMDIMLTGEMDGIEAAQQICDHLDIPVVYLTAYSDDLTLQRAKVTAPFGYIVKPFEDGELHISLEIALFKHKLEKKLRESEERYRTVFEIAPDLIFSLSAEDGMITSLNPAFERTSGWSRSDWLGRPFKELVHPDDLPLAIETFERIIRGENPPPIELRCLSKWGEYLVEEFTGVPQIEDGRVVGEFGFARNITERKRAEMALMKAHEDLERRVEERTAELEAKNAEMERFIYTVSHDLRSPLITIQGFAGFLKRDLEKGDRRQVETDLGMIRDAVTKMDQLLKETLELSRIGRVANPAEEVPFGEIVQEAIAQTGEKIKSSGTEVSVAQNLPSVYVDRMRMVEVLVNLIENSIKYMGEQMHPRIEIGCRNDGNVPVFFVQDNGIGIDPSQQEKVFELFYKVNKKSEGTGAGLAIVKRIIEVHGGHMGIESELCKGCTVWFTLPQGAGG